MSEIEALRLLTGAVTLIFALEDWSVRAKLRPWSIQRGESPVRRLFDRLFSERGVVITLALRAAAALALLISPHPIDALTLIVGHWLWAVRWRGTYNGGSDAMTLITLVGLLIYLVNPAWERAALIYVGVHVITSFLVAGLAKIRNAEWRDGRAPRAFLGDAGVRAPARLGGWLVMVFELTFPLALVHPVAAWTYVGVGLCFHAANAYVFGLSRFLLAWLAAYPAVIAMSR